MNICGGMIWHWMATKLRDSTCIWAKRSVRPSEVIGVPAIVGSKTMDEDRGRYDVIPIEAFRHAFKTPTLRNVARTSPYMHNGIYNSLEQVVDFYEKGGGVGQGIKVDNQTLPFDKLELTPREKEELIAFLRSLDSKGDPH
jgi:cytochrome c peroxidase